MAKPKSSVRASNIKPFNFNPNLNITFINPDEVKKYRELGYKLMVSKQPNTDELLKLTPQEIAITKLLLLGNTPQQIAGLLSIDDSNVRKVLQHIRDKMHCDNNIQLVIKMIIDGLDSVLSQIG